MTFWQENYAFIKEVYDTRYELSLMMTMVIFHTPYFYYHKSVHGLFHGYVHSDLSISNSTISKESTNFIHDLSSQHAPLCRYSKMVEWMDNVEMAIAKVCASKVYTSAEFKREKDNFQSLCKNLERAETKK